MPSLIDLTLEGRKVGQYGPWPRVVVDASRLDICGERTGAWTLEPARPLGRAGDGAHGAAGWTDRGNRASSAWIAPTATILPSAGIIRRRCGWNAPSTICSDCSPTARPIRAPGSITAAGTCASAGRSHDALPTAGALPLPAGRGRRPAPDRGRPGACGHHRARTFPLHRQRRDRGPPGSSALDMPTRASRG